jgi:hypothetical protein
LFTYQCFEFTLYLKNMHESWAPQERLPLTPLPPRPSGAGVGPDNLLQALSHTFRNQPRP